MHTVTAESLRNLTAKVFTAAGSPEEVASYIAYSLVNNNLLGHDSHGVIRVPRYLEFIGNGRIKPAAQPEIVKETATTAVVSGNWTFGQVAAKFAAEVVIRKAKQANVAAAGLVQLNHTGRIGEFAEMLGRAGLFGVVMTGGTIGGRSVAPFGGRGGAFSTNPCAFAVPAGERPMVVIDFATSVVAEGKLQVARAKHQPVAPGMILDKEGRPSTNPEDYYNGGVLLPFGGHKGYALGLLVELLGACLGGTDIYGRGPRDYGTFFMAVNVEAFRPLADFGRAVDGVIADIKAIPPAEGFDSVLVPGEPEQRSLAQREREGIPLPEETWEKLLQAARDLGIEVETGAVA